MKLGISNYSEDGKTFLNGVKNDIRLLKLITTGKGTSYTIEINEEGIQEFFEVIKESLTNEQGTTTGIIGLINHVTEYEQMKKKLEETVRTDELTGLYSRYYFDEYLRMASLLFRMALPKQGVAFRTGSDEFIILLPSISEETA